MDGFGQAGEKRFVDKRAGLGRQQDFPRKGKAFALTKWEKDDNIVYSLVVTSYPHSKAVPAAMFLREETRKTVFIPTPFLFEKRAWIQSCWIFIAQFRILDKKTAPRFGAGFESDFCPCSVEWMEVLFLRGTSSCGEEISPSGSFIARMEKR